MRFLKFAVLPFLLACAIHGVAQTIQINRENKTIAISTTDEPLRQPISRQSPSALRSAVPMLLVHLLRPARYPIAFWKLFTRLALKTRASKAPIRACKRTPISMRKRSPNSAQKSSTSFGSLGKSLLPRSRPPRSSVFPSLQEQTNQAQSTGEFQITSRCRPRPLKQH